MFNSKKIQKLLQQQDLLEAKINLIVNSQKTLSEDFEVHFRRLRQTIYTSVEELSSELQNDMRSINKSLEKISQRKDKDAEPCVQEPSESPIMDKMRFNPLDEILERPSCPIPFPPLTKMAMANAESESNPIRKRGSRKEVDSRATFFINAKLPEGVFNYLHNRSANKSISTTCRNVFEREGKLVFAPLSYEITKNFSSSNFKVITIQVSKTTYLAMRKIGKELRMPTTNVANNFIASLDTAQSMEVAMTYSRMNSKELQFKTTTKK
jgi:hypothetical protein